MTGMVFMGNIEQCQNNSENLNRHKIPDEMPIKGGMGKRRQWGEKLLDQVNLNGL